MKNTINIIYNSKLANSSVMNNEDLVNKIKQLEEELSKTREHLKKYINYLYMSYNVLTGNTYLCATAPTGSLSAYLASTDPVGWVICDGQPRCSWGQ